MLTIILIKVEIGRLGKPGQRGDLDNLLSVLGQEECVMVFARRRTRTLPLPRTLDRSQFFEHEGNLEDDPSSFLFGGGSRLCDPDTE